MFKNYLSLFLLLNAIIFISCDKKTESTLNDKLEFDSESYKNIIKNTFIRFDSTNQIQTSLNSLFDTLSVMYSKQDFEPFFIKSYDSKSLVDSILTILGNAPEHGLNPEIYNFTLIKNQFDNAINQSKSTLNSERLKYLANTELLLVESILKYSEHMRHGVVNPRKLYPEVY